MIAPRWLALYVAAALVAALLTGAVLWRASSSATGKPAAPIAGAPPGAASAVSLRCPHRLPRGASLEGAWQTTVFFVTDVLLRENPVCGYDLSSRTLRGRLSRAQWANGEGPVEVFHTQYPPVPVARASNDPASPEAVYVLSRTVREMIVSDERGRVQVPMMVGLSAPDAGMAAYDVVLVLENGRWRVDRASPVELKMSDRGDPNNPLRSD